MNSKPESYFTRKKQTVDTALALRSKPLGLAPFLAEHERDVLGQAYAQGYDDECDTVVDLPLPGVVRHLVTTPYELQLLSSFWQLLDFCYAQGSQHAAMEKALKGKTDA